MAASCFSRYSRIAWALSASVCLSTMFKPSYRISPTIQIIIDSQISMSQGNAEIGYTRDDCRKETLRQNFIRRIFKRASSRLSLNFARTYRPVDCAVAKFVRVALTLHGKGDNASGDDLVYELRLTAVVKRFAGLGICVAKHRDRFGIKGVLLEEIRTFTHDHLPLTQG